MKTWLKTELHTHTNEDPMDGGRKIAHSAEQLIEAAAEQGFEVLSITNHNQLLYSSRLAEYAEKHGILLIPGVEATLQGKHVLLYNFLNYTLDWKHLQIVSQNKGREQLVIAPHPFFPSLTALGRYLRDWRELFDGIEYNHFYLSWLNFNRRGQKEAQRLRLPMVGNSDVHHLFQLGRTYTLVHAEKDMGSVFGAIREGNVRIVTDPVSLLFVARWFASSALGSVRQATGTAGWFPRWNPARGLLRLFLRTRSGRTAITK